MSKSQEKRLAIQDASKSHTYELLCEILGLCLEMGYKLFIGNNVMYFNEKFGEILKNKYPFTLNGDTTELEKAKQDLINYKIKENK